MVQSTILGYPRIGLKRELKKALEQYWKQKISQEELEQTAKTLRQTHWQTLKQAKISYIPSGDFSYYDHVLDMSLALGIIPSRYAANAQETNLDTYFAMARGTKETPAMEMTKWFDTNYHYIVPEFEEDQSFKANAHKYISQYLEAKALGIETRPVLIGPLSFLLLGKFKSASQKKYDNTEILAEILPRLLPAYQDLLTQLEQAGVQWVQLDEPFLVTDLSPVFVEAYQTVYETLRQRTSLKLFVASYFGSLKEHLSQILHLPVDALQLDFVQGKDSLDTVLQQIPDSKILSLGLVNGRNIWRTHLETAAHQIEKAVQALGEDRVWVSSSSSLLHVPYTLEAEKKLAPDLVSWFAFARQKLDEITLLARVSGKEEISQKDLEALEQNRQAFAHRAQATIIHKPQVQQRLSEVKPQDFQRKSSYPQRAQQQQEKFALPQYPTTTIGSFPQTPTIRKNRSLYRKGALSDSDYQDFVQETIRETIHLQEEIDLDVLVHGECERNDMVEYFGENLAGFAITQQGWVQSYGSRVVKPPVLYGDIEREKPITIPFSQFAQSQTSRPVKGMLTGPVTILQWSFVRDDLPREAVCKQIALALREEVRDLEKAGIGMIQIDEPALREGLPLRRGEQEAYLSWATQAFRLAASGVEDQTQIHTHMCYSEFNDIMEAIAALDADVISIETSRSQMELLDAFVSFSYPNAVGPGVYDIHSPRVPDQEEILALLTKARHSLKADQIWVNPDCGLKTRNWPEVTAALKIMVKAAKAFRQKEASLL